jgi:hypothetical protein
MSKPVYRRGADGPWSRFRGQWFVVFDRDIGIFWQSGHNEPTLFSFREAQTLVGRSAHDCLVFHWDDDAKRMAIECGQRECSH